MRNFNCRRNAYKPNVFLLLLSSFVTQKNVCNTRLILLQNKPLGIWSFMIQKYEFPKYVVVSHFCKLGNTCANLGQQQFWLQQLWLLTGKLQYCNIGCVMVIQIENCKFMRLGHDLTFLCKKQFNSGVLLGTLIPPSFCFMLQN